MTDKLNISIRELGKEDEEFLWEMLYHAIYIPEGIEPPPRDILNSPELNRYANEWGKPGDMGFIAVDECNGNKLGAVWIRLLIGDNKGFGYIDDLTPELSIAVVPRYRGQGVGGQLIRYLFQEVQFRYPSVSLSVSTDNPALRLYRRLGFETVSENHNSMTMIKVLGEKNKTTEKQ